MTLYVVVALANYSLVQSFVGSAVSSHFSKEWGGKVKIGALGCNPFNHLILRNVELINPSNDTICMAHTLAFRFRHFPFDSHGLTFSHVRIKDTYYHLNIDSLGLNLKYIFDHYASDKPSDPNAPPVEFKVLVDDLFLDHVTYRQDLKHSASHHYGGVGVDIPHMEYRDIVGRFRNVRVDKAHVTCRIDNLTTTERSGLEVRRLHMNVFVSPCGISATNMLLETADSRLEGDVLLDYRDWKTMGHFLDSVYLTCHFLPGSYGSMRDAAFWAPTLWPMDQRANLEGYFCGPISDFHAEQVHISFGDSSVVDLDASICGLPHIDTTVITGTVHHLYTTYDDLAAVKPPRGITMKAPQLVKTLQYVDMEATFSGTINDFFTTFDMKTAQGDLKGDVVLAMNSKSKDFRYVGELSSNSFVVGKVAPNEWVSRGGFELSFEGNGLEPKTMNASASGRFHHIVFRGQRLMSEAVLDIEAVNGTMSADFSIDDPLAAVSAHGEVEWRDAGPAYSATVDAEHVNLKQLGLWNGAADSVVYADGHVSGRYVTLGEDHYFARLTMENARLQNGRQRHWVRNAAVTLREQNRWKNIDLNSDILTAQMRGYFRFDAIGQMVDKFVDDFVPQGLVHRSAPQQDAFEKIAGAQFEIDLEWNDTTGLLQTFVPQLDIARGTTVQANYNFAESLKPLVRSDSIRLGSVRLYNVGVNGESMADHYRLRLTSDEIRLGAVRFSEESDIVVESSRRDAYCRLFWLNSDQAFGDGDVNLRLVSDSTRMRLVVDRSELALGGQQWLLSDAGDSYFGNGVYFVDGLKLYSGEQMIVASAAHRKQPDDGVYVQMSDFGLDVVNALLAGTGVTLGGVANGDVSVGGLDGVLHLDADLQVADLLVDGELLGDARVLSTWNADANELNFKVFTSRMNPSEAGATFVSPLRVEGNVALGNDDPGLAVSASFEDLGLQIVQPFVRSFASEVGGVLSGTLDIDGTVGTPRVQGLVYVDDGAMKVDFLNVRYGFSDTLRLAPDAVLLDQFRISDENGNVAVVNGQVSHQNLKNLTFDLDVNADRLLCMNTTMRQSESYYGTVLASVDGKVSGTIEDLNIVLNASTLPGSSLNIPIDDKKQVKTADYIVFTSDRDDDLFNMGGDSDNMSDVVPMPVVQERQGNRFRLTINVNATPDMQMHIPMHTASIDANIKARGYGDLQLEVSSESPFLLRGGYELNDGTLALNIFSLRSWDFSIDEGSSINFPGAVSDALFDISAVYSQRVNMSTLTGSLSATESQKQINVQNVITLNGTLQNPGINFDIRLPNADQSVQEEVFAYIDRDNDRDMLNQTVSLLLFNRFYSAASNSDMAVSSVADEGFGLVTNSLSSVVSSMVQVVDVNFEYKAGNSLTTDQYAVDISKEWNKFYFETTFGFGGEAREMSSVSGNNNMTGDMLVGYKINPRLHLFVFNRSNTNDYTRSDLPYKQGLGLKYTRDFDTFRELFRRKARQSSRDTSK